MSVVTTKPFVFPRSLPHGYVLFDGFQVRARSFLWCVSFSNDHQPRAAIHVSFSDGFGFGGFIIVHNKLFECAAGAMVLTVHWAMEISSPEPHHNWCLMLIFLDQSKIWTVIPKMNKSRSRKRTLIVLFKLFLLLAAEKLPGVIPSL